MREDIIGYQSQTQLSNYLKRILLDLNIQILSIEFSKRNFSLFWSKGLERDRFANHTSHACHYQKEAKDFTQS